VCYLIFINILHRVNNEIDSTVNSHSHSNKNACSLSNPSSQLPLVPSLLINLISVVRMSVSLILITGGKAVGCPYTSFWIFHLVPSWIIKSSCNVGVQFLFIAILNPPFSIVLTKMDSHGVDLCALSVPCWRWYLSMIDSCFGLVLICCSQASWFYYHFPHNFLII